MHRAEPSFGPPAALITLLILLTFNPACAYAVSRNATVESDSSDAGQSAYADGRFIDALRIWRPRAEQGDARAAFGLGLLYDLGEGVGQDAAAAYGWYRRAAEAGYVLAEFNLGVMCDSGVGTGRNATEAALWYARAAAHGYARAEYNLAQLYETGDGVPRNLDMATSWYAAAAAHGLSAAAHKVTSLREEHLATASPYAVKSTVPPDQVASLREERQGAVSTYAAKLTLTPAIPTGPSVTSVAGTGESVEVELSWAAPAQTVPVDYFVQVLALDTAGAHRAFASFLKRSAVLVSLPRVPAAYAWRVYTVAASVRDYVPSAWSYFSTH
jgi:Sel1 repeat